MRQEKSVCEKNHILPKILKIRKIIFLQKSHFFAKKRFSTCQKTRISQNLQGLWDVPETRETRETRTQRGGGFGPRSARGRYPLNSADFLGRSGFWGVFSWKKSQKFDKEHFAKKIIILQKKYSLRRKAFSAKRNLLQKDIFCKKFTFLHEKHSKNPKLPRNSGPTGRPGTP